MDIENIDLCHYGRGELIDLCEQLRAQNARLQSIIDEANAQEPVGYMVRGSFFYSKVQAEKSADHLTANYENTDVINVYVDPIPAQQSVDRDTIINVLLSIGNMSEGIIADAIISAIGALQSPAVAVSDSPAVEKAWSRFQAAINNDDNLIPAEGSREQFYLWADEKGFCMDEIWSSVGEPFESKDTQLAWEIWQASRSFITTPSPRITEQDAREIISSYAGVPHHITIDDWVHEEGLALLNKLNNPGVGG